MPKTDSQKKKPAACFSGSGFDDAVVKRQRGGKLTTTTGLDNSSRWFSYSSNNHALIQAVSNTHALSEVEDLRAGSRDRSHHGPTKKPSPGGAAKKPGANPRSRTQSGNTDKDVSATTISTPAETGDTPDSATGDEGKVGTVSFVLYIGPYVLDFYTDTIVSYDLFTNTIALYGFSTDTIVSYDFSRMR